MRTLFNKLPPAAIALLLQAAAFAVTFLIIKVSASHIHPLLLALLCGTIAAIISRIAGLARWWLLIQLLFVPTLVLAQTLKLPPYFFLGAFLILLAVYWSAFLSQVPLYLSSRKIWQAMELLLPAAESEKIRGDHCQQNANDTECDISRKQNTPRFTFMDLGSGIGGVLTHLASVRPDGSYHGIEAAPLPYLWSWLRVKFKGYRNCTVKWGSLWDCDLSKYDVVFAYLSPVPMDELWHKAHGEMRPGSVFISNTFLVIDQPPQQTFTVDDLHRSTLYIWHM